MVCKKYCKCDYCANNKNCPLNHCGDGNTLCGEFLCSIDNCKYRECISYEDLLEKPYEYYGE